MSFEVQNTTKTGISSELDNTHLKSAPQVLNMAHLSQYTSGDAGLERELLGMFKDQAVLQFENIQSASSKDDWVMAVHTLKGSARSIGAEHVAALTADLEFVGYAGDKAEKHAVTNQLKHAVAVCIVKIEQTVITL